MRITSFCFYPRRLVQSVPNQYNDVAIKRLSDKDFKPVKDIPKQNVFDTVVGIFLGFVL